MWNVLLVSFACLQAFFTVADSREMKKIEREVESCPVGENCVSMCCDPGKYFIGTHCQKRELKPPNASLPLHDENLTQTGKTSTDLRPIYGYPCKNGSYALKVGVMDAEQFYLLENGTLYITVVGSNQSSLINNNYYCVASTYKKNVTGAAVIICFTETEPPIKKVPLLYPISMLLSLPFLLGTFVAYSVMPDLDNLHGLTLRAYIAMLFLAYLLLAIVQLFSSLTQLYHLCSSLGKYFIRKS